MLLFVDDARVLSILHVRFDLDIEEVGGGNYDLQAKRRRR